jgi:hypothetical protein
MVVSVAFTTLLKSVGASNTLENTRASLRSVARGSQGVSLLAVALLAATALTPSSARAAERDAVRDWNAHAIAALVNANTAATPGAQFSPTVGIIHLAIVQGAVYDAVNAIKGGHDPYLDNPVLAPTNASKGAAAATAAHHVLIALIDQAPTTATLTADVKNAIKARLDASYATSLAEIPAAGQAKAQGIKVGAEAAAAMLLNRAGDGRFGAPGFPVPAVPGPGQWRPLSALPSANDPNGWVRSVRPFTLPSSEFFHTSGPAPLASPQYATEFNEVKALGRATGSTRTDAQTSLAYWSAPHPVPMMFAAMRQVSVSKNLTISQDARFFAMTSMTTADTIINCFAEKAHWSFWRPITAIQLADTDGNADTDPDAAWTGLLPVPPYGDEPSGANCFTSGLMNSAKAFFGSDQAEFDIISAGIGPGTGSTRHYSHFTDVIPDMIEARILAGLHFRKADVNGALLGQRVANYVDANFFNCGPPGQCKKEELE